MGRDIPACVDQAISYANLYDWVSNAREKGGERGVRDLVEALLLGGGSKEVIADSIQRLRMVEKIYLSGLSRRDFMVGIYWQCRFSWK